MDYSLLLVIEKLPKIEAKALRELKQERDIIKESRNAYASRDSKHVYHLGLIDFLQAWNCGKKAEACAKGMLGKNREQLSAVN